MTTDLLTEVLRHNGLSARKLALSTLQPELALQFPCNRSVGLHMIVRGPVYLHMDDQLHPLKLEAGDITVMARGEPHALSLSPRLHEQQQAYLDIRNAKDMPEPDDMPHVLSGAYQFWHAPLHPLFAEMPAWLVLHATDIPDQEPLAVTTMLLSRELRNPAAGAHIITHGLFDVAFAYVMREVIARRSTKQVGWCQGMSDPQIGRIMMVMQENLAQPWTLDTLAKRIGMSRTALAERFRTASGDTPLNHLRTLRMQRAMQLLVDTRQSLDAVATAVGYQDAFGFSKVFKRTTGMSPRTFRMQDAAERDSPYRFKNA